MKTITVIALITILTGCSGMVKGGALIGAEKALKAEQYDEALSKAEVAEHLMGDLSRDKKAKINYIRGEALEGLGRRDEAIARFRYVADQLKGTPHAYLARAKLESIREASQD
ncbi:MAG: tol-pal system YbgF family protein [Burkholderiaceae bacterium]